MNPFRRHLFRNLLTLILLLLTSAYLTLFFGLNYFGERFLRDFLQKKIHFASKGIYSVDFRKMNFNIITGKISIDSFELIPDTQLYRQLKARGLMSKSLYRASFSSVTIDRIHFWQIYSQQRVTLKQLIFDRPVMSIVGFPDTATARKARWRVIYEDIYPTVSGVFKDFHIDSVKVNHGMLLTSFRLKTGKLSTGEYEFSTVLRDVSVNPFSYYNRERVFYSRDIDWKVHNFEYIMADSLYFLKAEELGFSLAQKRLYGKDLSLRPNFALRGLHARPRGDFYKFNLPAFSIGGIDLYEALVAKKVRIRNLDLNNFTMKVYHNLLAGELNKRTKKKEKFKIAGMYTVIAGALRSVTVDTLSIKQASFEYYAHLNDASPEVRIGSADLRLNGFFLDSTAHLDKQKIFYASEIELVLNNFNLRLRDQIHRLSAGRIQISTANSAIEVRDALLFPDNKRNLSLAGGRKNTIHLLLPQIKFNRIDLKKLFNHRIFDFEKLEINEPDLKITRYRLPKTNEPRFKNPEDFFTEENEDLVYDLLKKYVYVVRGNIITVLNGHGTLAREKDSVEKNIATAHFDLEMQQFLIDSIHGMNQQGYFYSHDFNLDLRSIAVESPDGMRHLRIKHVLVKTADSLIEAEEISFDKTTSPGYFSSRPDGKPPLAIDFSLKKLHLTGLNHKKLFLDKILKANMIVLENPALRMKAENGIIAEGPPEETQLLRTGKIINTFEIGRLVVNKGALSYDGLENVKASYFSMKDIDFGLLNARIHLPEKEKKDGLISFDSLKLKIFPFRAVIADSNYAIECKELDVHSYPADITLRGLKLTPLRTLAEMPGKNLVVGAVIPELKITSFYFDRAIFNNEWRVGKIRLNHPVFSVEIKQTQEKKKAAGPVHSLTLQPTPFMEILDIGSLLINRGEVGISYPDGMKTRQFSLKEILLEATRIRVDSGTRVNPEVTPLFNADNIVFTAPGFNRILKDSLYTLSFGRFGFSTKAKTAFVDSVSLVPNLSREDFLRKLGYEADRMEIFLSRIDLNKLDFREMLVNRRILAGNLWAEGLKFSSYRDKRGSLPAGPKPSMPQQMIRKISLPVEIDTISLTNAFAAYEEQAGKEPGRLFFDRMNVMVTGFSTIRPFRTPGQPSRALNVHGTASFMGKAPVEAWFWFPTDHPRDSFTLRATVGLLDLRDINPMLSKLMPVSVTRGISEKVDIRYLHANDSLSRGFMDMKFSGLRVRLEKTESATTNKIEQALLTELANILLPDNNPNNEGRMRTGIIYFTRDRSKGFFNFVWKSTLSGLKSSAGFNTKTQREIRRTEKKTNK